MRICYLGWGDHVHVERWAGYFARLGHDVSVISDSKRGTYPPGVKQYLLQDIPKSERLRLRYLRYLLWKLKPDLVHVHWAHFASLLKGIWSGPLVITAWGSDIYCVDTEAPDHKQELIDALRSANIVTCDSVDLRHNIEELAGLSSDRVEVVQWGVDVELFTPASRPSTLDRTLGIEGRPVVLSPRHFLPLYDLGTIISGFRRVLDTVPNAVLLMKRYVSDAVYEQTIQEQIRRLNLRDSVFILDRVAYEQMPDFYRSGEVLVSLASSDATPMSMLEGMACRCVPIVSDLPSLREWIRNGWNGYIVAPGDSEAVATAITDVILHPELRQVYGDRNVELVMRQASQQANMAKMEKIYEKLLNS
jgi:L-malate glycosyltransferase